MTWKDSLRRAESTKPRPHPTISRPQPIDSVSSVDSKWWEDDGRPISAISNILPTGKPESRMSESIYSQPRDAPAPAASIYSMPLSDKPLPQAYASIAASAPPISPTFDNGTGKLDPEIVSQIKKTGKVPLKVRHTPSLETTITSAKPINSSQPQTTKAPGHQSMHLSVGSTTPTKGLHPIPLNLPTRKKAAGAGPAGTRSPVAPVPLSKKSPTPKPAPAPTDVIDIYLQPPCRRSPPPTLPTGKIPRSYPSRMLLNLETENLHRSRSTTKRKVLHTRTRNAERQGMHLANAAERPYRPAKQRTRKGTVGSDHRESVSYAAGVAAGRSIWNAMRTNRSGVAAGYRRNTWDDGMARVKTKGRVSQWEGHWLSRGSVRTVKVKKEKKEGKGLFTTKEKKTEDERRYRLSEPGKITGDEGSLNNRISRMYIEGDRVSLAGSFKERKGWWQENWRCGDGYWERIGDGKKGKGKRKKDQAQEQVRLDESPEVSGWYSDSDP